MPNLYSPRADLVVRAVLVSGGLVAVGAAAGTYWVWGNRAYSATSWYAPAQPVMFSHEHHVGRLGLDCRYCHANAEESDFAGIPAAETCMNCHLQLYTSAAMLQPVRDAWATGKAVAWRRVYVVADFVRFSHKVHVQNGVACVSCHGRMDEQPLVQQVTPVTMGWCLECHRHPAGAFVDAAMEFDPAAKAGTASEASARVDREELLTNCSACHY